MSEVVVREGVRGREEGEGEGERREEREGKRAINIIYFAFFGRGGKRAINIIVSFSSRDLCNYWRERRGEGERKGEGEEREGERTSS